MKELLTALFKAKQEIPAIAKTADNPFFNSKYADLETVLKVVEPILFKHGLLLVPLPMRDALITRIFHVETGQFIESQYPLNPTLDAQKLGASITYARRYALSAMLSLATEADNDGNELSAKKDKVPAVRTPNRTTAKANPLDDI